MGRHIKHLVGCLAPRWLLYRGRHPQGRCLALSFDDGPHPAHSPGILDVLNEAGVRATFFVVGEEAEKHPELIRRMLDEGHEVANHTYTHYGLEERSSEAYIADIERCQKVLEAIAGHELERSFRPPYGTVHPAVFLGLIRRGYRMVLWSVDSDDSRLKDAPGLVDGFSHKALVPGDVILLHEDYAHTLRALPALLQMMRDQGFDFVPCRDF